MGINIEDGTEPPHLLQKKIEKIKEVAAARGIDLFVNARTDVYLKNLVDEKKRVEVTVERGIQYQSAGADGFFVPALTESKEIIQIVEQVGLPLNVLAWPGLPSAETLGSLEVRRLSAGSGISRVLWSHAEKLVQDFLETGNSEPLMEGNVEFARIQELFAPR